MLKGPRNGKTFLPPRSRSPIKTNLGSSPRRSMGAVSSPTRLYNQTPTRALSHPVNESILDNSIEELTPSIEGSKLEGRSSQLKRVTKAAKLNGRGVKRPFNLSLDDEDDEAAPSVPPLPAAPPIQAADFDESQNSLPPPRTKPGKGRPPKLPKPVNHVNDVVELTAEQTEAVDEELPIQMEEEVGDLEQVVEEEVGQEAGADENDERAGEDGEEQEPAQESEEVPALKKTRRGRPLANSRKEQNAQMKPPPPRRNSIQRKAKTAPTQSNKPSSRSVYVSRSETPAQDSGARTTRAGRNVLKPVAFWRGERIVYGDGLLEGSILTLPGIKEVIRTEEVAAPRPKRPAYRRSKPTSRVRGAQGEEEEEEEEDEREPWETEAGIVRAQVLQWDSITGRYDEENTEEAGMLSVQACTMAISPLQDSALISSVDVAYAAEAIQMRDIGGSDFRFAKTLTLPFFGSGMVDLPPGGAKRVKNSRKMQLIFFVYYGRVTVEVGTPTTTFSIGKGGMWQVPRGKFYLLLLTSLFSLKYRNNAFMHYHFHLLYLLV